jgi:hypothetical protein
VRSSTRFAEIERDAHVKTPRSIVPITPSREGGPHGISHRITL